MQSATRRRSPPESVVTSRSPSGRRSASIARSSVASRAPRVAAVDLLLHLRLLGEQCVEVRVRLRELRRDRVEAVEQVAQRAHAVLDVLAHVPGRVELRFLGEHAHGRPGSELGDSARGLLEPGHDPQQRRLAGAVRAEHADLRPGQERERDVRQHLSVRPVELVGPVHREDVVAHGESTIAGGRLYARRVSGCCARHGQEELFGAKTAAHDARRYRRKGPDAIARSLARRSGARGVEGATVLEIGGGDRSGAARAVEGRRGERRGGRARCPTTSPMCGR